MSLRRLKARVERREAARAAVTSNPFTSDHFIRYRDRPHDYIKDVLGLTLTNGQADAVSLLMAPPQRLLVGSGHSVGKTVLAAALVNWWFDTREGICLTTAPTDRQVKDLLWKEVRGLRQRADLPLCFAGPKIPRLERSPSHFAHGFTATESTRFQGHHSPHGVFIVFDEAEGVDPIFWESAKTMLDDQSYWLCIYNPTTPGSAAHQAEMQAEQHNTFNRLNISCLEHPNIDAQLQGKDLPVPGAITLSQLEGMLLEDSLLLSDTEPLLVGDVELNGRKYRPGPIAEARALGRRPTNSTTGIWSQALWDRVMATRLEVDPQWPVAIGCDVARYGDDHTVIVVRKGLCLMHAETHVKVNTKGVAQRLRELCHHFKDDANDERLIPCMIDEGGIGGGVLDQSEGYLFVPVNASRKPRREDRYYNVRAELWFNSREPALQGKLDVSRLSPAYVNRLKQELLVATYQVWPANGKIRVLAKDDMKAVLKRSPDLADAFALCLYPPKG